MVALCICVVGLWGAAAEAGEELATPQVPEEAFDEDGFDAGEPRVEARLLMGAKEVRPGDAVAVGVLFDIDPGWHIYWRSSGQGGMPTTIDFEVDEGSVGPTKWPEPRPYNEAGGRIITFGYSTSVLLFAEAEVAEDAEGEVEISADVDYLVCEVDCIPGSARLRRALSVGEEHRLDEVSAAHFHRARDRLPRTSEHRGIDLKVGYSKVPIERGDEFRIEVSAIGCQGEDEPDCISLAEVPEAAEDAFVFESVDAIRLEVARVAAHPEAHSGWFVELNGRATQDEPDGDGRLRGVLRLRDEEGNKIPTELDVLLPRVDSEEAQALVLGEGIQEATPSGEDGGPAEDSPFALWYVLLLAFLGGAVLNLMPCVFPVLAVKVFAFVNLVHEERQNLYVHSATYTAGIVVSMLVLAAVVLGLQVVGTHVGWGFQFQEPLFVAVVGAVLVVFALNLFGVFEVTLGPGKLQDVADLPASPRRSFGEGVLAVILATPCSAPMLGTAVGFALANSAWTVVLIFMVLGLGLAAPFVLLTWMPGAAKFLPRPGPWMKYFKQGLGFALLGTAIWLLWLIGQMTGVGGVTRLLIFFLACSLGVWLYGIVQFRSAPARRVGLAFMVAIVALAGFWSLRFDAAPSSTSAEAAEGALISWKEWSEEAVQEELAAGRPVFVDFTADWCVTCKVNEANVLERTRVLEAIEEYDVAMFMADWTHRDEAIRLKLAEFGKAGVPMYLVYSPEAPQDPQLLPELLTRTMVVEAMESAARP